MLTSLSPSPQIPNQTSPPPPQPPLNSYHQSNNHQDSSSDGDEQRKDTFNPAMSIHSDELFPQFRTLALALLHCGAVPLDDFKDRSVGRHVGRQKLQISWGWGGVEAWCAQSLSFSPPPSLRLSVYLSVCLSVCLSLFLSHTHTSLLLGRQATNQQTNKLTLLPPPPFLSPLILCVVLAANHFKSHLLFQTHLYFIVFYFLNPFHLRLPQTNTGSHTQCCRLKQSPKRGLVI